MNVTERKDEVDENSSTLCTSALKTCHKPRVEGISPYPVMEIAVLRQDYWTTKVLVLPVNCMKREKLTESPIYKNLFPLFRI